MKAKRFICVLLAMLLVLSLAACGGGSGTADTGTDNAGGADAGGTDAGGADAGGTDAAASKPETITMGVTGWLGRFLDGAEPSPNLHACDAVYDSFFLVDPDTAELYSYIFESWGYIDETTLELKLKPGITFTDGDEATAEDVYYSIFQHVERGSINVSSLGPIDMENSKVVDNYTVHVKWTEPYGPGLSSRNLYLFDKDWCVEKGWDSQDWYSNPNGTGPYKVTEYVTDDHLTIELKDNYWNSANEEFVVKKWIIKYFPDASTMYMALEKGEISLCSVTTPDYTRWVSEGNSEIGMKVCSMGGNMNMFLGYENNPIFNDINVRKALAYGVNWEEMGYILYGDLYTPALSIINPLSPFYKEIGSYEFNPELAKQILADAGYKEGDLKIHLYEMTTGTRKDLAEAFQYYCSELGIQVEIEFGDVTSALQMWMSPGGSDAGFYNNINGVFTGEPHESLSLGYVPGFTWCMLGDQALKDKFIAAVNTTDEATRAKLYAEIQQYVYDNFMIFPIAQDISVVGYRTDIFTEEEIQANVYSSSYTLLHNLSLK